MADNKLLQQMLEHLVNEDQQKAEELFHEYVVAASREIYEGLIESEIKDEEVDEASDEDDEDQVDEASETDDDEVEEDFSFEADDEMGGDPTDDLESDLDAEIGDDDMGDDDMGDKDPGELFQDLESIVDELQAKFDEMGGSDDMGDDGDMDMGDDGDMDTGDDEEVKDSFDDELATVREYVEKIGAKMGDNGTNTKSIVAGKNDMGGTTANIVKGGTSESGGTKGGLAAPTTKEDNAGNVNVPGGKAGVKHLSKEPGHGAEKKGSGDDGDKSAQSLFRGRR
jgi:hypothetical protein